MLQMMQAYFTPLVVDDAALAVEAIREVGPGGHFFGSDHTMTRYETAFYAPLVSNWDNYPNWLERGGVDATARANAVWKQMLAEHEDPGLDRAVAEALGAFVARRKAEGGAPMN
jgi:trimethylamine---corrinoid protein Co-methyltransferase